MSINYICIGHSGKDFYSWAFNGSKILKQFNKDHIEWNDNISAVYTGRYCCQTKKISLSPCLPDENIMSQKRLINHLQKEFPDGIIYQTSRDD